MKDRQNSIGLRRLPLRVTVLLGLVAGTALILILLSGRSGGESTPGPTKQMSAELSQNGLKFEPTSEDQQAQASISSSEAIATANDEYGAGTNGASAYLGLLTETSRLDTPPEGEGIPAEKPDGNVPSPAI